MYLRLLMISHFTIMYLLQRKREVFKYFLMYEIMAIVHLNLRISKLRCDNGHEYTSNKMIQECQRKGIRIEYTLYNKNDVAKRMNRTIIERARCTLLHSKLDKNFWSEAVLSAVYIIN